MCARRFLIVIFILTMLVVTGAFAIYQFGGDLLRRQAVPTVPFQAPPDASAPDYIRTENWLNLPNSVPPGPAEWRPSNADREPEAPSWGATFFIHPTTYLERDRWNALIGHRESQDRAVLFVRSQASAFNRTDVYAPKYRQAAFGAFLDTSDNAARALDLAYGDVLRAFERFLVQEPSRPIVLAGHSQGALHLTRLLRDRVAKDPALQRRVVAAYVVGWPVSTVADIPAMGLAACTRPDQGGCIASWQSFAEPANTSLVTDVFEAANGFNGQPRRRGDMLCVNPVTGSASASVAGQAAGMLIPDDSTLRNATLGRQLIAARCEGGFLKIEGRDNELPELGPFVLPGNNYHVYDYALFWADIRRDLERRRSAWAAQAGR